MDAMISLQCASSEHIAKELVAFLRKQGYSTWICIEMEGGSTYREEIVVNASGSKTLICLMNVRWAESKECRYEFNIATRSNLTKGFPQIIPIILENFDFNKYPLITGVMANTNAIFYNAKDPSDTWNKVDSALRTYISPQAVSPDTKPGPASASTPAFAAEPLPDKMIDWTSKQVAQWVDSLSLSGSPKDAFINNWVDGRMLFELSAEDLRESLKFTGLQSKRMIREIEARKKQTMPFKIATSELKSQQGFLTGIWQGYYEYNGNQRDSMAMDVTMIAGIVAGYGTDPVGDFLVQGTYDDDKLTISWEKAYVGQHSVFYTGKLEDHKTIRGTWEIPGDWNGKFELTHQ